MSNSVPPGEPISAPCVLDCVGFVAEMIAKPGAAFCETIFTADTSDAPRSCLIDLGQLLRV